MSLFGDFFTGVVSTMRSNITGNPQIAQTGSSLKPEPRTLEMPTMASDSFKYEGSTSGFLGLIVAAVEANPWGDPSEDPVELEHDLEIESIERDATDQPLDPDLAIPYGKASAADLERDRNYARDMSLIRKIDPHNPALATIRPADTIPSVNEARNMHTARLNAECPPEGEAPATGRGSRQLVITPKAAEIARENQSLSENQKESIRKKLLPLSGEVPYQPPKNWKGGKLPQELIGGRPVFHDRDGMLWKAGRSVTPGERTEWDVQPPNEHDELPGWIKDAVKKATGNDADSHANISLTGKVTH